jgi:hypothetical protein
MDRFDEATSRALDAAQRESQEREDERRAAVDKARHDLGNLLSIASVSVEGMLDGIAPITNARLNRLREVLSAARSLVYDAFPRE